MKEKVKFNIKEMLSRDQMKEIKGSSGPGGTCASENAQCFATYIDQNGYYWSYGGYCQTDHSYGCLCVGGGFSHDQVGKGNCVYY